MTTNQTREYMGYEIEVGKDRITIDPQMQGVAIEAHYDYNQYKWVCSDGFNTVRVPTIDEAISEVEDAIGYYAITE